MVPGSARRPIPIASFGGAATATDTSSTATSPNPIPHARRLDMRASSGMVKCPASCPNHLGLATARRGAKIPAWEDLQMAKRMLFIGAAAIASSLAPFPPPAAHYVTLPHPLPPQV